MNQSARLLLVLTLIIAGVSHGQEKPEALPVDSYSLEQSNPPFDQTTVAAAVPLRLTYQGVLTGPSGAPVADGSYNFTIRLFDVPSGGTAGWTDNFTLPVARGSFTAVLGSGAALNVAFDRTYFVEVTVTGGPPGPSYPETLLPRTELTSAPYALAPWVPSGGNISYRNGNVGIGTDNPQDQFHLSSDYPGISMTDTVSAADMRHYTFGAHGGNFYAYFLNDLRNDGNLWLQAARSGYEVHSVSFPNGRVGIGTSAPVYKLDVTDDINIAENKAFRIGGNRILSNPSHNTFLGKYVGLSNTTGDYNTGLGEASLSQNTEGNFNTAVGVTAMANNTTGGGNTAVGMNTLVDNTAGSNNTAIGVYSLRANVSGNENTATGDHSLSKNTSGSANTANGEYSLAENTSGDWNSAVGGFSLGYNTTGSANTAVGWQALVQNTEGGFNSALGQGALSSNVTGTHLTGIGAGADVTVDGLTNATAIGYNAKVSASNSLVLGNNANVGIGTSSPTTKLDVVGDIALTWPTGQNTRISARYDTPILTTTDGTSANNTPGYLNGGSAYFSMGLSTNSYYYPGLGVWTTPIISTSPSWAAYITSCGEPCGALGDNFIIRRAPPTSGSPVFSDYFVINHLGNTGIGTNNPTEKLEVAGNVKIGEATIRSGSGSPEGAVTGNVGDLYLRTDGGAGTTMYVKESGAGTNTGWVGK